MADIILVPGLWLDAASWDQVVPGIEAAGHRALPLTLPGLESNDADRSGITLRDHVAAVVEAIDAGREQVVLVGHSAGGAVVHAAVDARPDRVARAVYVGGFPTGDGGRIGDDFAAHGSDVPLPDWSFFDEADLRDLDDDKLTAFRGSAVPSPAGVTRDVQSLTDERRYDVPVTMICPEFSSDDLKAWVGDDLPPVRELTRIKEVDYVDLPTGHWPQFTRPVELARVIVASADRS